LSSVNASPTSVRTWGEERIGAHRVKREQCAKVGREGEFESHRMSLPRLCNVVHPLGDSVIGVE